MPTPITELPGIGSSVAAVLAKHGYKYAADIAVLDVETLCAVPGFGPLKAEAAIEAAKELEPSEPDSSKPKKSKKKKNKKKSEKKSDKKKSGKSGKKDKKKKSVKKDKSKKKSKKK
jgi:hypothetical protein